MYKPISNYNNPTENPTEKSLLCKQVELGEIEADQLLCCPDDIRGDGKWNDGKCKSYSPDCLDDGKKVAKCHNLTNFDACRRTDANAARVCSWKDVLFCLSVRAPTSAPDYKGYPEAIKQMVSRNTLEESFNATNLPDNNVTFCNNGTNYQLCNSGGNLRCGDLFEDEYNCVWWSGTDINSTLPRYPLGELCENLNFTILTSTVTSTAISTSFVPDNLDWKVGQNISLVTYLPLGVILIGIMAIFSRRWNKLMEFAEDHKQNDIPPSFF